MGEVLEEVYGWLERRIILEDNVKNAFGIIFVNHALYLSHIGQLFELSCTFSVPSMEKQEILRRIFA